MPAPTLTNCISNIGLNITPPRVHGVPKGSVLETFFSQFLSACVLSSSELQSIPPITSLSTAAITAALPQEKHYFAGKPLLPNAIQCKSSHAGVSSAGDPASRHRQTTAIVFVTIFFFLTTLPIFQSKGTPYILSYSVNPTIIMWRLIQRNGRNFSYKNMGLVSQETTHSYFNQHRG